MNQTSRLLSEMKNASLNRIRLGADTLDEYFPAFSEIKRAEGMLFSSLQAMLLVEKIRIALRAATENTTKELLACDVSYCFDRIRERYQVNATNLEERE